MNRFELWDKVARNWQYRWQQPFRSVVALCGQRLIPGQRHLVFRFWAIIWAINILHQIWYRS